MTPAKNMKYVVINEILAYIQSQMKKVESEKLIRACIDNFSNNDINIAMQILTDNLNIATNSEAENKNRRQILRDIIEIFTQEEDLPIFVAQDLSKIPGVNETRDLDKLSDEVSDLRMDVAFLKCVLSHRRPRAEFCPRRHIFENWRLREENEEPKSVTIGTQCTTSGRRRRRRTLHPQDLDGHDNFETESFIFMRTSSSPNNVSWRVRDEEPAGSSDVIQVTSEYFARRSRGGGRRSNSGLNWPS